MSESDRLGPGLQDGVACASCRQRGGAGHWAVKVARPFAGLQTGRVRPGLTASILAVKCPERWAAL